MSDHLVTYDGRSFTVPGADIDRVRGEIAAALASGGGMVRVASTDSGSTHVLVAAGVSLIVEAVEPYGVVGSVFG